MVECSLKNNKLIFAIEGSIITKKGRTDKMRGLTRFFCILVALYNFYLGWGISIATWMRFLNKSQFANENLKLLIQLALGSALLFVVIHSVRLIMLFHGARKIQLYLSGLMPIIRIVTVLFFAVHQPVGTSILIAIGVIIFFAFDIGSFVLMIIPSTRQVFTVAEAERRDKWLAKKSLIELR